MAERLQQLLGPRVRRQATWPFKPFTPWARRSCKAMAPAAARLFPKRNAARFSRQPPGTTASMSKPWTPSSAAVNRKSCIPLIYLSISPGCRLTRPMKTPSRPKPPGILMIWWPGPCGCCVVSPRFSPPVNSTMPPFWWTNIRISINPNMNCCVCWPRQDHQNLFVIGDPNQAIYGFRGAQPKYFNRFTQDWPTARTISLAETYRVPYPILALARKTLGEVDPKLLGSLKLG